MTKKRGCPTCSGVDPKTCLRCAGKTNMTDWYPEQRESNSNSAPVDGQSKTELMPSQGNAPTLVERLRKEAAYESQFKYMEKWEASLNKKTHDLCIEAADRIAELEAALKDIVSPIAAMQRNLREGEVLHGSKAFALSQDVNYLQNIAQRALQQGSKK